jgi:O-antigen/teichoic acid export membrane protein
VLVRNVSAGLLSSVWSAALGFAVVPIYLRYLGVEAYGLVGFLATLQAVLQLLDMGIAPTLNREVARHAAKGNLAGAAPLLRTVACIYWPTALIMAAGIAFAAPAIAEHWLQSRALPREVVEHSVILLGVVIACRWPNGIYLGALMGAQRLDLSSAVTALTATFSSIGGVLVLTWLAPTLPALFAWQACAALLGTLTMQQTAWRVIGRDPGLRLRPDLELLRGIWRFSVGIGAIGLMGLIFMQMDKVLLSRLLPLEEFGHYMLAATVAGAVYVLAIPFFNAVYPRFSTLIAQGVSTELASRYRRSTQLLTTALFPITGFLVFFPTDLVAYWTGNLSLAYRTGPVVSLLAAGSAIHGVMHIPHALQLAAGRTDLPIKINGTLLVILVPLTVYLASSYGAIGGGIAWLLLHILYILLGTVLTHRHLLRDLRWTWISRDVVVPGILSAAVLATARGIADMQNLSPPWSLLAGAVAVVLAAATCVGVFGVMNRPLSAAAALKEY